MESAVPGKIAVSAYVDLANAESLDVISGPSGICRTLHHKVERVLELAVPLQAVDPLWLPCCHGQHCYRSENHSIQKPSTVQIPDVSSSNIAVLQPSLLHADQYCNP